MASIANSRPTVSSRNRSIPCPLLFHKRATGFMRQCLEILDDIYSIRRRRSNAAIPLGMIVDSGRGRGDARQVVSFDQVGDGSCRWPSLGVDAVPLMVGAGSNGCPDNAH